MKTRHLILTTTLLFVYGLSFGQRIVCDETCKLEFNSIQDTLHKEVNYAVVCPVGRSTVKMIQPVARLNTLAGKTIALVGGSFMASITHPEIKRLILQNYPTARVLLFDEIGAAGVYPAPGITRKSKDEFQKKLQEFKVDAVISGNCGCGLCTLKETGSCIAAEYASVPAVAIAAPAFVREVYYTEINNGIPAPRVVEYPGAFASHTHEQLIKNTREVLWSQIVDALTRPITAEECAANEKRDKGDLRDDVFYGTLEEVNNYFHEQQWSDGLPIIPPTYNKVEEFLKYTDKPWNETVAILPLAHRNTTTWHVAVNGVMAGCKPEYMPILIAMTEAIGSPEFRRTLASTHGWIPYSWLNGPVCRQLGISCGAGEISDEANTMISRFMNLALMNLAGYYIGSSRMGTFGYPMSWCMVEDDEACKRIGWQPYHVRQGFDWNDNTITVSSSLLWGNNMAPSTTDPQKIMELLAWDISERCQFALGSGKQFTCRTLLITEPVASNLAKGYKSPAKLESALISNSRRPLKERAYANYYANPGSSPDQKHPLRNYQANLSRTEYAQWTATPAWYDSPDKEIQTIATMQPGMTAILVTGDVSRNKVQTMPGGGYATVKIKLPKDWDSLMKAKDYPPLENFVIH